MFIIDSRVMKSSVLLCPHVQIQRSKKSKDFFVSIFMYSGGTPEQDWSYDPSEPRYCICNQVSYGDMVACDNEDVSIFFIFLPTTALYLNLKISPFTPIYISRFIFSVHTSGFTIPVLVSMPLRKASGIVLHVQQIWPDEKGASKNGDQYCTYS